MWGATYTKVTNSSDIVAGGEYLVVYESSETAGYAMTSTATTTSTKRLTSASVTISSNSITSDATNIVWTLEASGSNFKIKQGTNYVTGTGSGAANVGTTTNANTYTITKENDNTVTIVISTNSDRILRFNSDNRYLFFAHYSASSSLQKPCLYKKGGGDTPSTPTALSAPSNLQSSNVTTTSATLSWDAVANTSSYTVKIGETEYTGLNTNSYSATGLTAGTQYTWTVMAIGDGVNYTSSDYATATSFTTTKVLNGISISGTLTKTTYEIGDLLNPSGLTVSADYGESEPTDVTASVVWSVYNEDLDEVPSFVTLGTNNYYIQASFGGKSDATDLISITVVEPSKKALVLAYDGVYYAATTSLSNDKLARKEVKVINGKVYVATEADKNAIAWTISETDTKGEYTISPAVGDNSAKYLSAASSSANLSYAETACNWKSKNDDGKISYWISKADGTQEYYRTITYQEGSTKAFKAYTASNIGTSGYASTAAYAAEIVVGDLISVSSAEYATYYNKTMAYTMPEGLVGITVEGVIGNTLTLETRYEAGDVVPAGEALLLHGKEGTYTLYAATTEDAKSEDNMLKGTSTADEMTTGNAGDKYYRLSQHEGEVGFYWGAADGGEFKPGANKAYLALNIPGSAPARFIFGQQDVPTELQNASAETVSRKVMIDGRLYIVRDGNMFDLNGRLVK